MTKTKYNGHEYVEGYRDPTAGTAINHLELEAKRRKLSKMELDFERVLRDRLNELGVSCIVMRVPSNVTRVMEIQMRKGAKWKKRVTVTSPRGEYEFELRIEDVLRRAKL